MPMFSASCGSTRMMAGPAFEARPRAVGAGAGHALASGEIDGVPLEVGERAMIERTGLGGAQHHARRLAGLERFLPARRA